VLVSAGRFTWRAWLCLCMLSGIVLACSPTALAAGDANEAECPPETVASLGFQPFLPDCRAWELVTPPFTEGASVVADPAAISKDGSHVIVGGWGAFGGDGNFVLSPRNQDGPVYELTRTESGWLSKGLTPSGSEYPLSALLAVSATDPEVTLWGAETKLLGNHEDIYMRNGSGAAGFHLVGPGTPRNEKGEPVLAGVSLKQSDELNLVGASSDLSHSVYTIESHTFNGLSDLWAGDTTEEGEERDESLYEYVYNGTYDPEPLLVGVRNSGRLQGSPAVNDGAELISRCGTTLGGEHESYNAVSESGESVFFTAHACAGGPPVNEVYVRVAAQTPAEERTVAVSEPPNAACGACNTSTGLKSASFEGASQNGQKVFFVTEQELLPGQTGNNLYEDEISAAHPQGKIRLVSGGSGDPEVQRVMRISEDGERVYFVAKGVLTGENAEKRSPEAGADNLYVCEQAVDSPGYRTVFVAKLLTPNEESALKAAESSEAAAVSERAERAAIAAFEEAESKGEEFSQAFEVYEKVYEEQTSQLTGALGPAGTLTGDQAGSAQATPDGGFLVFESSAPLTQGDENEVLQLFEYDADGETLTRVSIGQPGFSSGNVFISDDAPLIPSQEGADLPTARYTGLAVSEDGSRVFFTSRAGLTPQAEPGATDLYEYYAGSVYLISGGKDASVDADKPSVQLFGADGSGRDVFFTSADQLAGQEGETQMLYDARADGGVAASVAEAVCENEACRGAPGSPQSAVVPPGTISQPGGGNLASQPSSVGGKTEPQALTRRQRLGRALRLCRRKRAGRRREVCEAQAKRKYGAKQTSTKIGRASERSGGAR
jgi:hypothetical protein